MIDRHPGARERDLPPDYGHWKNVHRRFCRWRDSGTWEKLLETIAYEPDYEWLMVDAHGMPLRVIITANAVHDSTQANKLIQGIAALNTYWVIRLMIMIGFDQRQKA